jgi:hypothetical protein
MKFEKEQMSVAVSHHFEIYKNLNNFQTLCPILTKFGMEVNLGTAQMSVWSKLLLFEIQDGGRLKKLYKKHITLKRFVICTKFGI